MTILNDVKHALSISDDNNEFDTDILAYIGGSIGKLRVLGVGKENFVLSANSEWTDLTSLPLDIIKSYIMVDVRLVFESNNSGTTVDTLTKARDHWYWLISIGGEEPND